MKSIFISSVFSVAFITAVVISPSCKKESSCSGMGTLKLSNNSANTVQRAMVDGVNHGSIDPGQSKEIKLAAGQHDWQLVGISGVTGCSAAKVTIVECQTTSFSCNN